MKIIIIILSLVITYNSFGQKTEDRKYIISKTNVQQLKKISDEFWSIQYKFDPSKIQKKIIHDGNVSYFSYFDKEGNSVYCTLENVSSAISSKIDLIRTGGSTGLDLDGSNIEFALWDGGPPRVTHQEYSGKITVVDTGTDSDHATHIAGTLIASGVNPSALGMAPEATIMSYTYGNATAEIASWAANGGIISSHSYIIANPGTNYQNYGIYNTHSQAWDELSYYAPYLIMCTGASNNGNNNYHPDNSRFDLLASNKLGKNSIVVGACEDVLSYAGPSSVIQAAFTSWGPTDDWRIKPDITAVGKTSFSTRSGSDSDYGTGQGCSYACPVVSGGLALLQQHYHDLNGFYMRAATAKGLILSTTDEAGSYDGPDFSNGWGLFNAKKAADLITNNGNTSRITELTLYQDSTYSTIIEVDGNDTLTVALCWNDPPAIPLTNSSVNNTTPMLINDLDLRVTSIDTTFKPWKLEPNGTSDNFTDAAIKGDNYRDNIEIIEEKIIPAGEYIVSVSHKNHLQGGSQDFSLIINGIIHPTNSIQEINLSINLYPNPTTGQIIVEMNELKDVSINVYRISGQLIYSKENINDTVHVFDIREAAAGEYIVEVEAQKSKMYYKLIKQ